MKFQVKLLLIFVAAIFAACSPSVLVKPLKKGEQVLSAHAGGPMIQFAGIPMPIPLSGLEYHFGLRDRLSLGAGIGLTSLLFGTFQANASATYELLSEEHFFKTGLSAFAKGHFLLDKWQKNFRFYPEAGFHAYRQTGNQRWYLGASAWFETQYAGRKRTSTNPWVPMLHAGWQRAEGKWRPSVELKWIAPGENSENLVVDYIGIAGRGSLGFYLGITKSF